MVRSSLALLALIPCAFATSFDSLRMLKKRQSLSGDATQQVQGLLALAQQVLSDAQSGNITAACTSWSGSLAQCESSGSTDQVALASCACQSTVIDQLNSCASSYGSTGTNAASGFESFCTNTLPSIAQTGLTSYVGASSTSSGSAAPSATSSLQSELSSVSKVLSSASASISKSASSPSATTMSASGTSAASRNSLVGGFLGVVGFLAFTLV